MMWMTPATGLAALNKQKFPTMGDDNRMPDKKGGKPDDKANMVPAFMPGQRNALANQLNQGFGGGTGDWRNYLASVYSSTPNPNFVPGKKDKPKRPEDGGSNVDIQTGNDYGPGVQPIAAQQRALSPQQMVGLLALRNAGYR